MSGREGGPAVGERPRVALIHLVPTPYWVHLHARLQREAPEIELHSVYTHDVPDQPWDRGGWADVRPVCFGAGEPVVRRRPIASAPREWAKGGRIIRWLRENRVRAAVVAGYNDAGRVRIIAWCRRAGVPCFLLADSNIHGDTQRGLARVVKRVVVSRVVRACRGVMAFGTAGRRYFERYGADPARVYFLPGEPDYGAIESMTGQRLDALRGEMALGRGRGRILFVGRLIPLKRADLLVDAFAEIAGERAEWDLVMVGDGPARRALEGRVSPDLRGRVRWLGFIGDAERLAAVYRSCDVLALPSEREAWAMVVNEAAAAGLALVVSSAVGAAEDLVREGENGSVFRSGDVADLARALRACTAPEALERMKRASREVLGAWRRDADPTVNLRRALREAGVLGP